MWMQGLFQMPDAVILEMMTQTDSLWKTRHLKLYQEIILLEMRTMRVRSILRKKLLQNALVDKERMAVTK